MMNENRPTPPVDTNQCQSIPPSRSAQLTEPRWYAKTSSVLLIVGAILSVLTWITEAIQSFIQARAHYALIENGYVAGGHVNFSVLTPLIAVVMVAIWVGVHTNDKYGRRRNTLAIGIGTFVALLFSIIESLFWSSLSNWAYTSGGYYPLIRDIMETVQDGIKLTALVVFALLIAYIVCYINERRQEKLFQQQVVKGETNE